MKKEVVFGVMFIVLFAVTTYYVSNIVSESQKALGLAIEHLDEYEKSMNEKNVLTGVILKKTFDPEYKRLVTKMVSGDMMLLPANGTVIPMIGPSSTKQEEEIVPAKYFLVINNKQYDTPEDTWNRFTEGQKVTITYNGFDQISEVTKAE